MESIEKQKEYFKKLTTDRAESTKTLENLQCVELNVVLLTNIQTKHILFMNYFKMQTMHKLLSLNLFFLNDGLTFVHNGTICFTVSNPETEDKDGDNKILGHVNAITSIGNTTKVMQRLVNLGLDLNLYFNTQILHTFMIRIFKFKIENLLSLKNLKMIEKKEKKTKHYFSFPLICRINLKRKHQTIYFKNKITCSSCFISQQSQRSCLGIRKTE